VCVTPDQLKWTENSSLLRSYGVTFNQMPPTEPFVLMHSNVFLGRIHCIGKSAVGHSQACRRTRYFRTQTIPAWLTLSPGHYTVPSESRFLWVTEFPLFTRADDEKEFLARGRWSSSHHPFTAPMSQDLEAFWSGRIPEVRDLLFPIKKCFIRMNVIGSRATL